MVMEFCQVFRRLEVAMSGERKRDSQVDFVQDGTVQRNCVVSQNKIEKSVQTRE